MEPSHAKPQNGPSRPKPPRKHAGATPELLFLDEVAEELRLSLTTIKRMIKAGELRSMRVAGQTRVSRFDLRAMLRHAREAPAAAPKPQKIEHVKDSYAELLGLTVLYTLREEQRAVYAATIEALEDQAVSFLLRARSKEVRSEPGARGLLMALRGEHLRRQRKAPSLANGESHDPVEPDELEQDELEAAGLLESDAEDLLREEDEAGELSADERAERREGDPQFDPYPEQV